MNLPLYKYDMDNGIIYKLEGDYYLPHLFPELVERDFSLSVAGKTHLEYMREHQTEMYVELAEAETLEAYLRQQSKEFSDLVERIAQQMGGDANAYACAREIAYGQAFEGGDS